MLVPFRRATTGKRGVWLDLRDLALNLAGGGGGGGGKQ